MTPDGNFRETIFMFKHLQSIKQRMESHSVQFDQELEQTPTKLSKKEKKKLKESKKLKNKKLDADKVTNKIFLSAT